MNRLHLSSLAALTAWFVFVPVLRAAPEPPPHADVGEDRFPHADAVVLRHEQTFTLAADRSIRVKEHRWIKMLSTRAIRRVADPRIDFREDTDRVDILVARTFTPDGDVVDVPDYSRNFVSPFGAASDPAFSTLRQWVISFSGVQPGAIYELAYERASKPAELPWMSADLRLANDDPVLERIVTVHVPEGVVLQHQLDHVPDDRVRYEASDDGRTHTWTFTELTHCDDESAAANWALRCPRLRFTTCNDASVWAAVLIAAIDECAAADPAIATFASEAVGDEPDPRQAVRKICEKLAERMRTLDDRAAWEGPRGRLAGEAFVSRYQNTLEAAAVSLVAIRAAGFTAAPAVIVDQRSFSTDAPVDADVKGFWVLVTTPAERFFVHPTRGIERPHGDNRDVLAFVADERNQVRGVAIAQGQMDDTRRLSIRLNLEVDDAGAATGRVRVELSGPLVDPAALQSDDQKRARVESIARRVLPGVSVSDLAVLAFSADEFRAEAKLKLEEGLVEVGRLRLLEWSDRVPAADGVNVPLEPFDRDANVALGSPVDESLHLSIEFPETWTVTVRPQTLPPNPSAGMSATILQDVKVDGRRIDVERRVRLPREIEIAQLVAVRDSINRLKSPAWRQVALQPARK